ncbi:MAG: hypothetical protein ACI4D5_02020 [Kineothrix sp.]
MSLKNKLHFLCVCALIFFISACGASEPSSAPPAPFSRALWSSTLQDLRELEQTEYETTASVYGGSSYIFPASYLDYSGKVKYMYDDRDQLVAIAFFYEGSDASQVKELYDKIYPLAARAFGESIHSETAGHNSGEKWTRKEGNVLLSVLSTQEAHALQYSFLHPSVSHSE